MRRLVLIVVLVAMGGGCRKKPELVRTPVSRLDPLGGTPLAPVRSADDDENKPPEQPKPQAEVSSDAGAPKAAAVPIKTSNSPTLASPYMPGGGSQHLPMWRQRAKFY